MDINFAENCFFQRRSYKRDRDFDSYSQSSDDIILHYIEKYSELDSIYKKENPISIQEFCEIKNTINKVNTNDICHTYGITTPFEIYTLAFIAGFEGNHSNAITYFFAALDRLDDKSVVANVNKIFIRLQIAQLYQRERQFEKSLRMLLSVYKEIDQKKTLMNAINNFFASCCVSIGLLFYHQFQKETLAGIMFYRSIQIRLKYKERYAINAIFDNYISSAYRYAALAYYQKVDDKYYFLSKAYKIRLNLLNNTNDNYTKEEFFFMSNDYLIFLIRNNYKIGIINLVSNKLYKNIVILNYASQHKISDDIIDTSSMLSKFYYYRNIFPQFVKWYSLAKYFKFKFASTREISFLDSEVIYKLIK